MFWEVDSKIKQNDAREGKNNQNCEEQQLEAWRMGCLGAFSEKSEWIRQDHPLAKQRACHRKTWREARPRKFRSFFGLFPVPFRKRVHCLTDGGLGGCLFSLGRCFFATHRIIRDIVKSWLNRFKTSKRPKKVCLLILWNHCRGASDLKVELCTEDLVKGKR